MVAGTSGDLKRMGDLYAKFSAPTFEAYARLLGGEDAIEDGRQAEGEAELERAIAFFLTVGAAFLISRAEASLGRAYSDSA